MSLRTVFVPSLENRESQAVVCLHGGEGCSWREQLLSKLEIQHTEADVSMEKQQQEGHESDDKKQYNLYVLSPKNKGFLAFNAMTAAAIENPTQTVVTLLNTDGEDSVVFTEREQEELCMVRGKLTSLGANLFDNIQDTAAFLNSKKM